MKFTSVFAVLACVVAAHAATVATLLINIAVIGSGAEKIDSLVQAYPENNGTVAGAQVTIYKFLLFNSILLVFIQIPSPVYIRIYTMPPPPWCHQSMMRLLLPGSVI